MQLTKQQVAREEIEAAIREFLAGRLIASHVLVSAASAIMTAVAKQRNLETYRVTLGKMLPKDLQREVWRALDSTYNFMKHATQDPEAILNDYNVNYTELILGSAIFDYQKIFKDLTAPMLIYRSWWSSQRPEWFEEPYRSTLPRLGETIATLGGPAGFLITYDSDRGFASRFDREVAIAVAELQAQ